MAVGGGRGAGNGVTPASNACFLFHLGSFMMFLYVFCWHFGYQAAYMPQAASFGWFFKFLTFCGFTFQMVSLLTCVLSHLFPEAKGVKRTADDMSCASFGIANVATLLHWAILFWTLDPVNLGVASAARLTLQHGLNTGVPLWLSFIVHVANAGVAWADILLAERTFRKWSLHIAMLFGLFYAIWIHVCAVQNEEYPYPFLNSMRQPEGTIFVAVIGFVLIFLFYKAGSKLASRGSSPHLKKLKLV